MEPHHPSGPAAVTRTLLVLCYLAVFLPLAWLLRQFHNVLHQQWDPERATYFDPPLQHDRSVADNGNRH